MPDIPPHGLPEVEIGTYERLKIVRHISLLSPAAKCMETNQYMGFPPELTGGRDTRRKLDPAALLVIESSDGQFFLYRYDEFGNCVGDTWHPDIDGAKAQAVHEYDGAVSKWQESPLPIEELLKLYCSPSR